MRELRTQSIDLERGVLLGCGLAALC